MNIEEIKIQIEATRAEVLDHELNIGERLRTIEILESELETLQQDNINPCPFCLSKDVYINISHYETGTIHFIECQKCRARGPGIHFCEHVEDKEKYKIALKNWNDREDLNV